ncbi:MAG TPA: hypothetical protein VIJ93_12030, partial [bacterium]
DELVKIPMAGKMSSLNASVASALLLFEVARQRKWGIINPSAAPQKPSLGVSSYGYSSLPPSSDAMGMGYSPPEKDFFRSGPDPALETPVEGLAQRFEVSFPETAEEGPGDPPGNDKGGGFRW